MWHLTGFSGVRGSFQMDFNGTLDSMFLLTPNKNLLLPSPPALN